MKAISIRQPWAWAILHAGKRVENRTSPNPWQSAIGHRVWIHASKGMTRSEYFEARRFIIDNADHTQGPVRVPGIDQLERGGIVGRCRVWAVRPVELGLLPGHMGQLVDGISRWATGPWCLLLDEVEPVAFYPCKGALGLFEVRQ